MIQYLYYYLYITDDGGTTAAICLNRGNTYYRKGDFDQAISEYSKAVETNPNYALTYNNRGLVYDKKNYFKSKKNNKVINAINIIKQWAIDNNIDIDIDSDIIIKFSF